MQAKHGAGGAGLPSVPSAYGVGQYTREWIVREAEFRRQMALVRAERDTRPGVLLRCRRKAGYVVIRAGMWLCAVRIPPREHTPRLEAAAE